MTTVCNVKVAHIRPRYKNLQEWMNDPQNIYIGRKGVVFINTPEGRVRYPPKESLFANPFKIKEGQDRQKVLSLYRQYITEKINTDPFFVGELRKLRGKNLGCWCKPEPCHGDILVEFINIIG